jgi:redox-sensitive bicupin YhaK (pirin superfamily)
MATNRLIRKVVKSRPTIEGAGVHLHRAIGWGRPEIYDPFLLLDDFRSDEPDLYVKGFPWHPHRGMEGKPLKQAVAIGYAIQRRAKAKSKTKR